MDKGVSTPSGQMSHTKILKRNYVYLRDNLTSGELIDYLYQEDVLTRREYNKLRDERLEEERTIQLIELLERKNRHTFAKFLHSLERSHAFVIDYLDKTTGLSLRKEFQVGSSVEHKRDTEKELKRKHEREIEELRLKLEDEKISRQEVPSFPAAVEEFHQAVRKGKLAEVKRLLSTGTVGVNCRGKKGRTPVMVAAWYRQGAIFDFLVQNHCDLSAVDDDNDNVFHCACFGGTEYIVKMLLGKHKFDIECRGQYGRTPLMTAVQEGHMSVVKLFRNEGSVFTTVDHNNANLLHVACIGGHVQMVQYVLSLNITHIESRGEYGRTPLMSAVEKGHMSVVTLLKKEGADFTTVDDGNANLLHVACIGGHVEMVQYVLSLNITHIECRGEYGRTPLMSAVEKGHMSVVTLLKKEGADFTTVDDGNDNLLHVACIGGHVEMVQYVLSLNITHIESRGEYGRTPLMSAVEKGHMSVVTLLKKEGADFTTVDDGNDNLLHVACIGGHVQMVQYVLSLNITHIESRGEYGRTPLMSAVEKGHMSVVTLLKKEGADFTTVDDGNDNLLHVACIGGHVEMVQYVLSLNITHIECRGEYGRTPLMAAVEKGHMSVVTLLKKEGADFTTVDDGNANLLHVACIGGHVEMVQYVLSLNITHIECRGQYGRTPLMSAVETGHMSVVTLLKKEGADFTTVDDWNDNLLHVACLGGHLEMVKYLVTLEELRGFEGKKDKDGDTPLQVAQGEGHDDVVSFLQSRN